MFLSKQSPLLDNTNMYVYVNLFYFGHVGG